MKHRNSEQLAVARENARKELEKRSKPVYMKNIDPKTLKTTMEKIVSYPSLTARLSHDALKKASPCPCDSKGCSVRSAA